MGIPTEIFEEQGFRYDYAYKYNLLNPENDGFRKELFTCLGLPENADFDSFNNAFGGLDRERICERING